MSSVIGPFYNPKKPYVYIFHKIADSLDYYKKDMYHFYGFGFEGSDKSPTYLFKSSDNHFFINEDEWKLFMDIIYKSVRVANVFHNIYHRHKSKKRRKYDVSLDLNMEPLETQSQRMKIELYHENMNYEFIIQDLLRIIKNALLTNDDLHLDSLFPKNPYNNIEFTKENMYKLFVTMRERNYTIPEIFNKFIKCNMDLSYFMIKNECYLRNQCIADYHTQFSKKELFEEVVLMLRTIRVQNIYLHIGYSKEEVLKQMTPIMTLYWHSIHNLNMEEKTYYRSLCFSKLGDFIKNNQTFGRVIRSRNTKRDNDNDDNNDDDNDDNDEFMIKNYLSDEIPYYLSSIESIRNYMRTGPVAASELNAYLGIGVDMDEETDEELSDLELVD